MLFHSTLQSWASSISQSFVTAASIRVVADLFVQILFICRFYLCYTRKGGIGVWPETTCGHALLGASFFGGVCEPHIYSTLNIICRCRFRTTCAIQCTHYVCKINIGNYNSDLVVD